MEEQIEADALKRAQCMRSHGVPNYADPTITFSDGGVSQGEDVGKSGMDPNSPTFQAAQKICQRLPQRRGGNGG